MLQRPDLKKIRGEIDNWSLRVQETLNSWQNLISDIENKNNQFLDEITNKGKELADLNRTLTQRYGYPDEQSTRKFFSIENFNADRPSQQQEQQICSQWFTKIKQLDLEGKKRELNARENEIKRDRDQLREMRTKLENDFKTNFIPQYKRDVQRFTNLTQQYNKMGIVTDDAYQKLLDDVGE